MALKSKIQEDFKKFLKEKKEIGVSTLRMLSSAIFNREKEKRYKLAKDYYPPAALPAEGGAPKSDLKEKDLEKESQLIDEEIVQVIFSEIKKRKEAIEGFSAYTKGYGGPAVAPKTGAEAGRKEKIESLIDKEKKEMEVLKKYLPEQLSEAEIKKMVKEVIKEVGAESLKDIGKVMGKLMPKLKGKAEGSVVNKIVKELLA